MDSVNVHLDNQMISDNNEGGGRNPKLLLTDFVYGNNKKH